MGWIGDQSVLPGNIFVLGTKRDFLISTLQLEPLAAQLPTAYDNMHTAMGARAMARQALAATQGQGQAASSSSVAPVQELAIREWVEQRPKELAARLAERFRRGSLGGAGGGGAGEAAQAEAPAEAAAEATEEEPEAGLRLNR